MNGVPRWSFRSEPQLVRNSALGGAVLAVVVTLLPADSQAATDRNGRIVYTASDGHDTEVFTVRADGAGTRQITDNPHEAYSPVVLPVRLADRLCRAPTRSPRRFDADIFTIRADGGGSRRLTDNTSDDDEPSYAPSGRRIVFTFTFDYYLDSHIYTMRAKGGGATPLTAESSGRCLVPPVGPADRLHGLRRQRQRDLHDQARRERQKATHRQRRRGLLPAYSPSGRRIAFVSGDGDAESSP